MCLARHTSHHTSRSGPVALLDRVGAEQNYLRFTVIRVRDNLNTNWRYQRRRVHQIAKNLASWILCRSYEVIWNQTRSLFTRWLVWTDSLGIIGFWCMICMFFQLLSVTWARTCGVLTATAVWTMSRLAAWCPVLALLTASSWRWRASSGAGVSHRFCFKPKGIHTHDRFWLEKVGFFWFLWRIGTELTLKWMFAFKLWT